MHSHLFGSQPQLLQHPPDATNHAGNKKPRDHIHNFTCIRARDVRDDATLAREAAWKERTVEESEALVRFRTAGFEAMQ